MYALSIPDFQPEAYEYNFMVDGKVYIDPCAYRILGREKFGAAVDADIRYVESKLQDGLVDFSEMRHLTGKAIKNHQFHTMK